MAKLPERLNNGQFPAFAFPGAYPIIYLDSENSILCAKCATKYTDDIEERQSFKPVAYDIYYEGPIIQCEGCNIDIESAYGDPEKESGK